MISDATIADIEARGWLYILGVRMRRTREARDEVVSRSGRGQIVHAKSDDTKAPSPLQVKEVWITLSAVFGACGVALPQQHQPV